MAKQIERCVIEKGFVHHTSPPGKKFVELVFDLEAVRELSPALGSSLRVLFVVDVNSSSIEDVKFAMQNYGAGAGADKKGAVVELLIKVQELFERARCGDVEFLYTVSNFYVKFTALLLHQINIGVPVSNELMTALLIKYGASEEDILANNMSMRTLLYLLKATAALQIFCDDPHYDGEDEQRLLIASAKKSLPYLETIHKIYDEELLQLPTYPLFDPEKIQAKVGFVVEQVYALYLTNAGTVTDADDFFKYFISEKERRPAESFDILANAMMIVRAYLIKNQDKINAYHREVFKDRY